MKRRVGIILGGKSGEHEVSLQSGYSIYEALDREKYQPVLIGVDKQGTWHLGTDLSFIQNASDPKHISLDTTAPSVIPVETIKGKGLALMARDSGKLLAMVDVVFPIIHGTYGEDGSLQGLLRLLNVPYAGADVLGSAVGMDKDVMKRLFKQADLPTPAFWVMRAGAGEAGQLDQVKMVAELGLPLFVKPANLGSSVGITKVNSPDALRAAITEALRYDRKVIIEEAIQGREIECAVLGNDAPEASVCGEIVPTHEFYSYEAKYIDEQGARLKIPAALDREVSSRIRSLAVKAFQTLECSGMARVDFFLKPDGTALINEINTLPGFTRISMYPKLWEASGLSYSKLLDRLIELALERHQAESALQRTVCL